MQESPVNPLFEIPELLAHILTFLGPSQDLLQAAKVSRSWYAASVLAWQFFLKPGYAEFFQNTSPRGLFQYPYYRKSEYLPVDKIGQNHVELGNKTIETLQSNAQHEGTTLDGLITMLIQQNEAQVYFLLDSAFNKAIRSHITAHHIDNLLRRYPSAMFALLSADKEILSKLKAAHIKTLVKCGAAIPVVLKDKTGCLAPHFTPDLMLTMVSRHKSSVEIVLNNVSNPYFSKNIDKFVLFAMIDQQPDIKTKLLKKQCFKQFWPALAKYEGKAATPSQDQPLDKFLDQLDI